MDLGSKCPDGEAAKILRQLHVNGLLGWGLGAAAVILVISGVSLIHGPASALGSTWEKALKTVSYGGSVLLLLGAVGCFARAKGRSGAWGLLGLGCVFGLVALYFLPSRCLYCGRLEPRRLLRCPGCGAPV